MTTGRGMSTLTQIAASFEVATFQECTSYLSNLVSGVSDLDELTSRSSNADSRLEGMSKSVAKT